jgi:hypothetical protein
MKFRKENSAIVVGDKIFILKSESRWNRRYATKCGKHFFVQSRVLDGSFNVSELPHLDPLALSESEKQDAALALAVAESKFVYPEEWSEFLRDWRQSMEGKEL